jgi:hypothetical protein
MNHEIRLAMGNPILNITDWLTIKTKIIETGGSVVQLYD